MVDGIALYLLFEPHQKTDTENLGKTEWKWAQNHAKSEGGHPERLNQ